MRRLIATLAALSLLVLAPVAFAESGEQDYKDKFDSGGYTGNDGTLKWSGPWIEVGENDGPKSGAVTVEGSGCSGKCLTISTGLLGTAGAYRLADTGQFAEAELSYLVAFDTGLLGLATLTVEATSNGGGSWTTIQTIDSVLGAGSRSVDVSDFRDEDFGVRFTATGALGAMVLIDDVKVAGELLPPTTSTTSTTTTTLILPPPTLPKLTTTTTTTRPTTTTTTRSTTTTTTSESTTTTTDSPDTTTTSLAAGSGEDDGGSANEGGSEGSGGLRQPRVGVESNFQPGLFGSAPEVLGFEIDAGFSNAVELVEASWYWVLGLALLIAAALIKGIDLRLGEVNDSE